MLRKIHLRHTFIIVLVFSLMMLAYPTYAYGSDGAQSGSEPIYNVNYVNVAYCQANISKSGTNVTCSVYVSNKKTVSTKIIMKLQRKESGSWKTVSTWSKDYGKTLSASLQKTISVSKGYTYRTYYTVTAGNENVTGHSGTTAV